MISPHSSLLVPVHRKGFALLLAVFVLAAFGGAIATSLMLQSIGTAQTAGAFSESYQAMNVANACAEAGLGKIAASSAFTGTGSLTVGQGTCTYTVIATSGTIDTVRAVGTVNTSVRRAVVTVSMPSLDVTAWQEVADF